MKIEKNKIKNEGNWGEQKSIDNNIPISENNDNPEPSHLHDNNIISERNKSLKPGNLNMNLNEEDSGGKGRKIKPDSNSIGEENNILHQGKQISRTGKKNNARNIHDPLDNKREEEQKVEKDRQSEKRIFHELKKCKIQSMDVNSKYNIFFIFAIQKKYIKDISLSTFSYVGGFFSFSYINYDFLLINKVKKYTLKREPIKSFIIQVPLEKKIKCLCFTLLFNNKFKEEFHTDIEVEGEDNNYFYLTNHHYEPYNGFNDPNGGFIDFYVSTKNDFISNYFSFFFDKTLKIKETYQKSLLIGLIFPI